MPYKRERVIGLALPHALAYHRRILRGIVRFAEERPGWRFIYITPGVGRSTRAKLKQVDLAVVEVDRPEWGDFLLRSRVPILNVGCVVPGLPIPRVGVDNRTIGEVAARHFLEAGLRSFAFMGHRRFLFSIEREQAFGTALKAAGHRVAVYHSPSPRRYDNLGWERSLDKRVGGWLVSLPRPVGVLAPNDLWGAEVTEVCRQVGLRVPEDVAVLGVDDDDLFCETARPPLSSVIIPAEAIGRRVAILADRQLAAGGAAPQRDVLLPCEGVAVRRSTDVLAIDDPDVVAAVRFVRENCHRSLRVADVLREVPVSRRSLERRMRGLLGITLGGEIRRTRLERARRLLTQTDLSIAQVALQSGFSDFRHLAVTFRQELGVSPSQYRQAADGG